MLIVDCPISIYVRTYVYLNIFPLCPDEPVVMIKILINYGLKHIYVCMCSFEKINVYMYLYHVHVICKFVKKRDVSSPQRI